MKKYSADQVLEITQLSSEIRDFKDSLNQAENSLLVSPGLYDQVYKLAERLSRYSELYGDQINYFAELKSRLEEVVLCSGALSHLPSRPVPRNPVNKRPKKAEDDLRF